MRTQSTPLQGASLGSRGLPISRNLRLFAVALVCAGLGVAQEKPSSPRRNEVRVFGGVWQSEIPLAGVEVSRELVRDLDVSARYAYTRPGSETTSYCGRFVSGTCAESRTRTESWQVHEYMLGVRVWLGDRDRVAPYLTGSLGGLTGRSHTERSTGYSGTSYETIPVLGLGAGVGIPIDSKQGVVVEGGWSSFVLVPVVGLGRIAAGWYRRF